MEKINVVVTLSLWTKSYVVTIQMTPLQQYFYLAYSSILCYGVSTKIKPFQ